MKFFIIILLLSLFSCNNKHSYNNEYEPGLVEFLENEMEIIDIDNLHLFYLILSDCSCIVENFDFVSSFLKLNKEEMVVVLVKVNNDTNNNIQVLDLLKSNLANKHRIYIDDDEALIRYGNIFITDKYFAFKNFKLIEVIDLKNLNYSHIIPS